MVMNIFGHYMKLIDDHSCERNRKSLKVFTTMEKKVYISPVSTVWAMVPMNDLFVGSIRSNGESVNFDTNETGDVTKAATKSKGQWDDFWDSLVN